MSLVWFWVAVVAAIAIYTFIALVIDAKIYSKPDMGYGERYGASLRGWSTSIGFLALGDFIAASVLYQMHGHLIDWEIAPLLITWPLVLLEVVLLALVAMLLSLLTAFIPSRVRIPWLAVGIVLLVLGIVHGATSSVKPPFG